MTDQTETFHACPPDGSGLTPCCGRTPFELPRGDRISSETVTCTGPALTSLRDLYAAAIASYDHAVGQATDPAPRDHHYGQADAVLAVRDRELEQLRQRLDLADQVHQQNVATLERVRAECDRIEAAVRANPTAPDFDGAYLAAIGHIRRTLNPQGTS